MAEQTFAQKPSEGEPWDVVIVGSGPSALTAAIYTTRGAASTLIVGGSSWGGQLMLTTTVDNFPGFPEGVQGPDLMNLMRKQAVRFGAEFLEKDVTSIDINNSPYKVTAEKEYLAKTVILATGAITRWLGIPGEEKLRGRGVSSCAPCDAPFFKDKRVAVVGGGDSAMEEALVLTKYATEVNLIHRRDSFKATEAMQQKVKSNDKIKIIWDTEVIEMVGDTKLESIKLKTKPDKVWDMDIDGVFVAIGHMPATEIFKGKIDLDEKGYIKKMPKGEFQMTTSKDNIFVAGDVHDIHYKQAITAAGFGCMAGMEALKVLDKSGPSW